MAFPQTSSFNGSSAASSPGTVPGALDTLIRGELKVTDARDAKQIATALVNRYKDDPRTAAITGEAKGLPFLLAPSAPPPPQPQATSSDVELRQAINDVERSLQDLSGSALLDDIVPEIGGLGQAVRTAIDEGSAAARFGIDPRQRDKVFALRRQLGEYARLARLAALFTPAMKANYRKLATSIDEVAAVLLVMLGEALANVGFSTGYYLLQVPFSELQGRRDTVVFALRNLLGSTQQAYGPDEWPRGVNAYRQLFELLEREGQGDLRTLLVEEEITRVMDHLIQRAGQGSADGLRALGVTAQIDLDRFRRLAVISYVNAAHQPPLRAFIEALLLFADAFQSGGGFRLLRVARPPILFYGLYNPALGDSVLDDLLAAAVTARGQLAGLADCIGCDCTDNQTSFQALLDFIVFSLDRMIDLAAVDRGTTPRRLLAYYALIGGAFSVMTVIANGPPPEQELIDTLNRMVQLPNGQLQPFALLMTQLKVFFDAASPAILREIRQELRVQNSVEIRWPTLVRSMVDQCPGITVVFNHIGDVLAAAFLSAGIPRPQDELVETLSRRLPRQFEETLEVIARDQVNG